MGTQSHINPGVKRPVVSWEHSKSTEFNCALNSNIDGFEKVNTLLDNVLTNLSEANKEDVNELNYITYINKKFAKNIANFCLYICMSKYVCKYNLFYVKYLEI